jgi:uncharacterized membrane protein
MDYASRLIRPTSFNECVTMSCSQGTTAYLSAIMKQKFFLSPAIMALMTAAICVAILAATNFGPRPAAETMVASATTASSVRAAGAIITPSNNAGY